MSKAIPRDDAPVLSAKEAEDTITSNLPPVDHHCEIVEAVGPNSLRIRLPFKDDFTGAERWQDGSGQIFSGPMVMGLADTAMYCCVMAALGKGIIPMMINLHITFLKLAVGRDLIAEARIVRRGARSGIATYGAPLADSRETGRGRAYCGSCCGQ